MSRPTYDDTIDLSDPAQNAAYRNWLRARQRPDGKPSWYRCSNEPEANTRSAAANRFWWKYRVQPFYEFLKGQDYDVRSKDDCHAILKEKLVGPRLLYKPGTDLVVATLEPTTHDMTPEEFSRLIDGAGAWLTGKLGIDTRERDFEVAESREPAGVSRGA